MNIDTETYKLPEINYNKVDSYKKHIIIGNTFNYNMNHYIGWLNRYNGKYNKTAAFTISDDGSIYQHFDPKYYGYFFDNKNFDDKNIIILIENYGYLDKKVSSNEFVSLYGNINNKHSDVVEKKWRNYKYWCPYNIKQFNSVKYLVNKLCIDFNIPIISVEHNTYIEDSNDYEPILYRSNIDKKYTDLNPSWDFELFKKEIENKN